jgi:hypothetical protein
MVWIKFKSNDPPVHVVQYIRSCSIEHHSAATIICSEDTISVVQYIIDALIVYNRNDVREAVEITIIKKKNYNSLYFIYMSQHSLRLRKLQHTKWWKRKISSPNIPPLQIELITQFKTNFYLVNLTESYTLF